MNPVTPPPYFAGRFMDLQTFSWEMNAAPIEGGIASEEISLIGSEVRHRFPEVTFISDPYKSPASIQTVAENPTQLAQADAFIRQRLEEVGTRFFYEA